jgi:thiamine-phosphate pyrophosphorylase
VSNLFDSPVRYLITPGSLTSSNFDSENDLLLETLRLAVKAGIELVQIREKSLPARYLFELAAEAAAMARGSNTRVLLNERFDIAIAAGLDGVHLTSTSISVERVRENVPDGFLIGVSTHSTSEVAAARDSGADFALLGPIFATPGKGDPIGLEELGSICGSVAPFPVIGVGGIDASNSQAVIDSGAAGYAAIRYLNDFVRMAR